MDEDNAGDENETRDGDGNTGRRSLGMHAKLQDSRFNLDCCAEQASTNTIHTNDRLK